MSEPPVLMNSPRMPAPSYTDDERSLLDHLGLPFYYRHTPTIQMRRGMFWLTFLAIVAVIFLNVLFMPHQSGSVMKSIRLLIFGNGPGYRTVVEGCKYLFNQFFVAALIFSGIIAPALATFSLANERVTGTMESLRLSPMSNTAIILGKIFASSYWLHLVSGLLVLLGVIFGLLGDVAPSSLALAVLGMVLGCATLHALGAFLAVFTLAARGFGAVIGLLVFGFTISMLPMAGWEERGFEFFAFLSPWGCMDGLFWHEMNRRSRYSNAPEFFGMAGAVKFYVLAFHTLAFSMLIWAASRKLEAPERPALPKTAWCVIWLFVLLTALGAASNTTIRNTGLPDIGWAYGALILIFGGLGASVLVILDHPHNRDTVLAEECERVAGREETKPRLRLSHAIFAGAITAMSAICAILFFELSGVLRSAPAGMTATLGITPVFLAFTISLAIESAAIGFISNWSRTAGAMIAIGILLASVFAPVVHMNMAYSRWHYVMMVATIHYQQAAQNKGKQQFNNFSQLDWVRRSPETAHYLDGIESLQDVTTRRQQYDRSPLKLFMRHNPQAAVAYPLVFAVVMTSLVMWRRRTYSLLAREAREAIARAEAQAPPMPPAQVVLEPETVSEPAAGA